MAEKFPLYVVATPIGNAEDITLRALRILAEVPVVFAEDTRTTRKLFALHSLTTPLRSFHAHSSEQRFADILTALKNGPVAQVSDAGTPAISDPGGELVKRVREAGHPVIPIPGPSAPVTALSAAGMNADSFTFIGFLPHKKGRQTKIAALGEHIQPVVLFESPHRLVKLLESLDDRYPDASIVVARELTKIHEELRRGSPRELLAHYLANPPRGEVVVIVSS